jgi:hypothetical protein
MTSRRTRLASAAVLVAILATVSAACGPGEEKADPTSTTAATTVPTTTTTTLSQAQKDEEGAAAAVVAYWKKINELGSDPARSLSGLSQVARGQALTQWQRDLTVLRGSAHKYVGTIHVTPVDVARAKANTFSVAACIDVSKTNVVDESGKSVVDPNRVPRNKYNYVVEKSDNHFYVIKDTLRGTPC